MKKVLIYAVAVAFLCVAGVAGVGIAADDKGPAEITLHVKPENSKAKNPKPAQFPHAAHQESIECDKCHKDANYLPGAWTKKAAHKLCIECHKANDAPKSCKTCHPKKK